MWRKEKAETAYSKQWEIDLGIRELSRDPRTSEVTSARCCFCENMILELSNREGCQLKRKTNVRVFEPPWRVDHIQAHMLDEHPSEFNKYVLLSDEHKRDYFLRCPPVGHSSDKPSSSTPRASTKPLSPNYPRDLGGYGKHGKDPKWPGGAKLAVQFVLNYEEGGESCILHGDSQSEHLLSEIVDAEPIQGARNVNMESIYEYGSRSGFWRLYRMLTKYQVPVTVFAVGMALERNPQVIPAMLDANWEIASHGYRWIDYQNVPAEEEKAHLEKCVEVHQRLVGKRPVGFYQGKPNERTRKLIMQLGGVLYDSDAYNDDLPYWHSPTHLIIPYTLCNNDMRFVINQGFNTADHFFQYLKDTFDELYLEGRKMMSIGLHCRIVGQPGRIRGLRHFLEYIEPFRRDKSIWVCRREEIAEHWYKHHQTTNV